MVPQGFMKALKLEKSSSVPLQYKSDQGENCRYVSQIKEKLPVICVKVIFSPFDMWQVQPNPWP